MQNINVQVSFLPIVLDCTLITSRSSVDFGYDVIINSTSDSGFMMDWISSCCARSKFYATRRLGWKLKQRLFVSLNLSKGWQVRWLSSNNWLWCNFWFSRSGYFQWWVDREVGLWAAVASTVSASESAGLRSMPSTLPMTRVIVMGSLHRKLLTENAGQSRRSICSYY